MIHLGSSNSSSSLSTFQPEDVQPNAIDLRVDQIRRIDDNVFTIVCVLVEAALVDNNFGDEEKNIIIKLLQKQYKIKNIEDINSILDKAVKACNEASDLITYTKKIKENWDIKKRIEVIEMLWKVCLVDGVLESYEDMLIRRISGLIYVDDKNRNLAKKNILFNVVRLGVIDTKMHAKIKNKNMKEREKLIPVGRKANISEIIKPLYFLSSSENTYITGEVINISGGE